MRGAGRIGGRAFRPPTPQDGGKSFDPFDLPIIEDLPVAPILTPINDNWSWSIDAEPADPRDCSRYPASPYCGGLPLDPKPFGVRTEIRSNGCETCVYIYPVVMWLMATPQVICYRDPNCDESPAPEIKEDNFNRLPKLNENVSPDAYKSPACADRESRINRIYNQRNAAASENLRLKTSGSESNGLKLERRNITINGVKSGERLGYFTLTEEEIDSGCFDALGYPFPVLAADGSPIQGQYVFHKFGDTLIKNDAMVRGEERRIYRDIITGFIVRTDPWEEYQWAIPFRSWIPAQCCGMNKKPPIKPPPPAPDDDDDNDRKRREREKKRGKKMCCNECSDAADNTSKLLKEVAAIKKALGEGTIEVPESFDKALKVPQGKTKSLTQAVDFFGKLIAQRMGSGKYPIEVPLSLMTLEKDNDKTEKLESQADYMYWLTKQLDALIGEFPIDIEITDIDPLTAGNQKKTIQLTNIAETLAEIYGLSIKGSVNQEAEQAILLRLAIEAIAIKNGVAITQDYVKANTKFLGYRGNPVDRKLNYSFDFSSIDLAKKEQTVLLDAILKPTEAYVRGWENKDKETAADFFQKLMFSAGIIKAVFFRDKKQMKDVLTKADDMVKDGLKKEDEWKDFVQGINNPNSSYNKGKNEQPEIKIETRDPNKPI